MLLKIVGVILILAIIALVAVILSLDRIVKAGVQTVGTHTLGVKTTLDGASVSVLSGKVGLDGLALGSPEGFKEPSMFALAHGRTSVRLGSLLTKEVVVQQVIVDGPEITLEVGPGGTNWGALLQRLKGEEASTKSQTTVRIDRIAIVNAKVKVSGAGLVSKTPALPDLEITGIRTSEGGGVTAANLLRQVIVPLSAAIYSAAGKQFTGAESANVRRLVASDMKDLKATIKEGRLPGAESLKEGVEAITNILQGIVGGKEDKKQRP